MLQSCMVSVRIAEKMDWSCIVDTGVTANVANPNKCISQKSHLGEVKIANLEHTKYLK